MGDNAVQIRVMADLSAVKGQLQGLQTQANATQQELQRTVAESLKMQNATALEAAQVYKQLGISGEQAAREIAGAFGGDGDLPAVGGGQSVNKALLSSRMSAQLLNVELGAGLPRAVTSAIGAALPAISSLSTALLGVFAAKEMYEFGKKLYEIEAEFDAVTAAENRLKEIGRENLSLLEKEAEENRKVLMGELQRAQFRAVMDEAELNAEQARFNRYRYTLSLLGMGYEWLRGTLDNVDEAQNKLTADHELADKMAGILREDLDKEARAHEKTSKAVHDHAAAEREVQRWREEAPRAIRELTEAANAYDAALQRSDKQRIADQTAINKLDLEYLYTLDQLTNVQQRQTALARSASPAVLIQQDYTATKHLSLARRELIGITQDLQKVEDAFKNAMKGEMSGLEDITQSAAGIAEQFASAIGGTKAVAGVKGAFDAALAIEYMAQFIGSMGTDMSALGASVQYGLAAEEMFKVAGGGGGSRGASGGGGGGSSQSRYRRGGDGSGSGGSGAATPGGGGGGTTVHLHLEGPGWTEQNALQLMAQMSSLAKGGQGYLTATNALTNGAKLT